MTAYQLRIFWKDRDFQKFQTMNCVLQWLDVYETITDEQNLIIYDWIEIRLTLTPFLDDDQFLSNFSTLNYVKT